MLTELRVLGESGRTTDIAVDHDGAATVGALVDALADALEPHRGVAVPDRTLQVVNRGPCTLDRRGPLVGAGLRRGDTVQLVDATPGPPPLEREPATLAMLVVEGPDRGRRHRLRSGVNRIGRSRTAQIRLTDESVSREHAALTVGWGIELDDLGGANGTAVDGVAIQGTVPVRIGSRIRFGDTVATIVAGSDGDGHRGDAVEVNRPPRLLRSHQPVTVRFPTPPDRPRAFRFPWISLLAGLGMGGAFMVLSGGELRTGAFYLLLPMLLVAGAVEARVGATADHSDAIREWRRAVVDQLDALCRAQDAELAVAHHRLPPVAELRSVVETASPRRWEREPHHDDFLTLRVGTTSLPTANPIEIADGGAPELRLELTEQVDRYRLVPRMPATIDLRAAGHVALAGRDDAVAALARSLVLQLAITHSPAEVGIAALVAEGHVDQWDWVKWLPHLRTAAAALGGSASSAAVVGDAGASELLDVIEERLAATAGAGPALLLVHDATLRVDPARMRALMERGPDVGVHVLWLGSDERELPIRAGATVVIRGDGVVAEVAFVDRGEVHEVALELTGVEDATSTAVLLAPLVDAAHPAGRTAELPPSATLPSVLGVPALLDGSPDLATRWSTAPPGLVAPIGLRANGRPLAVDLCTDGPHALVAGTTGSGKSELLQTLVASLAVTHPPTRLNVLLVDFKGGAAFAGLCDLPHTAGVVTDLDADGAVRVLASLRAEVARREQLLAEAGAPDLPTMERTDPDAAPPSLVIVVDEFAALSREVPHLVEGLVDVAQRGRSLGLHLVLATQRPAGVVTEAIRANTNLRIALRMADAGESLDVVDSPLAASIPRSAPGRAVARIGADELHVFQAAWMGGRTASTRSEGTVRIAPFRLGPPEGIAAADAEAPTLQELPAPTATDLERVVALTRAAASALGAPPPFRPWTPPLPSVLPLDRVAATRGALTLGLVDRPDEQRQHPLAVDLGRDGHLLITGPSGSGKTTFLRTVAVAALHRAATEGDRGAIRIDAVDAAGRGLAVLEHLPVVGSVLDAAREPSRVLRLLRSIGSEMGRRAELFERLGVDELDDLADPPHRWMLLVDGLAAFVDRYERLEGRAMAHLERVLAEGRRFGLHVVAATERRRGLLSSLTGGVTWHLQLGPVDAEGEATSTTSVPGRGWLGEHLVQVAVPGDDAAGSAQQRAIRELGASTDPRLGRHAPTVPDLPEVLQRGELPASRSLDALVVGVRDDDLEPARIDVTAAHVCVFGTAGSGTSTTLGVIAAEVAAVDPGARLVLLEHRAGHLGTALVWDRHAVGAADAVEVVEALAREAAEGHPATLVIDDLPDLVEDGLDGPLHELLRVAPNGPVVVVAGGDATRAGAWSESMRRLRSGRHGLLLVPHLDQHGELLGVDLPRTAVAPMVPGRGYLVERNGRPSLVQVCLAPDTGRGRNDAPEPTTKRR